MSKKILLIDMDNTIVDYSSEMAKQLRPVYCDNTITAANWDSAPYSDLNARRHEIQSQPNFFLNLPPIEGAIDTLMEIEATERYEIFIVSSPSISSETCHSDKCRWLLKHLGVKFARNLILTKDKTLILGDILIDDKPYITGVLKSPSWELITFAQPYNADIPDRVYLHRWCDWEQTVRLLCNQ